MRFVLALLLSCCALAPATTFAQTDGLTPVTGVSSNAIRVLEAAGDSVWVGPFLTVYVEDEQRFLFADNERLQESENVVFAIDALTPPDADPSLIWSALAFDTGNGTPGAGGFLVSTNGGGTFDFRPPQLDSVTDTTITYGDATFPAIPVTQPANNTVQSIDVDPATGTVWIAGGQSGVRRSTDGGETWTRAVLPPDSLLEVAPNDTPPFRVGPPIDETRGFRNHVGFSVHVDETGTVWAGTAGGVNVSAPDDALPSGDRAWTRIVFDGTPDGLTGNNVVAIAEQPRSNTRNPIWMATWAGQGPSGDGLQRFGVTVTRDGGETFDQDLIGAQVFDFAFREGIVYAAASEGLYVSDDDGQTWRTVRDFRLVDDSAFLRDDAEPQAVEVTPNALWVATSDGLLRLPHAQESALLTDDPSAERPAWTLFRTDVPVNPEEPSERVPDVATYAYPNPFSPSNDRVVRIRYQLEASREVTVEIFDFGMNRVRTLRSQKSAGPNEETVWDGTDARGLRLPNGPYFYTVETDTGTERGKILLVE